MTNNYKKLTLSFLINTIIFLWLYYIINLYDQTWTTLNLIKENFQYVIFLFISVILWFSLIWNKDKKSQFILWLIILINFIYIIFSFVISNIWLTNSQNYFLMWFLILALISNYIKSRIWHTITIISVLWIISTLFFAIIPMYETWPDIQWFTDQFSPQIIIFSKVNINQSKASISLDDKIFNISNWLNTSELKIKPQGSQILFKSDKKYKNTFAYLLFPDHKTIQIYPQSALNITKTKENIYQIEIIDWIIKHYPTIKTGENPNNIYYSFTWEKLSHGLINQDDTKEIFIFYENKLKEYITKQIWWDIMKNELVLKLSDFILQGMNKILPQKFKNNLENFKSYQKYLDIDLENKTIGFDNDEIKKDIFKEIWEAIETTQTNN